MKTVRLPLYEDGLELMEYLEIDVEHFLGAAGDATAHRYMRVVQMPTPEQEKEMIDRIISGLPTRPFFEEFEIPDDVQYYSADRTIDNYIEKTVEEKAASAHYRLHENGQVDKLVKHENLEWGPPMIEWREIPGWSGYLMNLERTIIDKVTRAVIPLVEKGPKTRIMASVMLHHEDGGLSHMNVAWLFRQTFPEL